MEMGTFVNPLLENRKGSRVLIKIGKDHYGAIKDCFKTPVTGSYSFFGFAGRRWDSDDRGTVADISQRTADRDDVTDFREFLCDSADSHEFLIDQCHHHRLVPLAFQ